MVGETLFCNSSGCNLHDFPIRAFGVCQYLDISRKQSMLLDAQIEANLIRSRELDGLAQKQLLYEPVDPLKRNMEANGESGNYNPPSPKRDYRERKPQSGNGGGVPL